MKTCTICGTRYSNTATICEKCDHPLDSTNPQIVDPNKKIQMTSEIVVTTGDLQRQYEVIGPVYFQVSNKGFFSSKLSRLKKQYQDEIAQMRERGQVGTFEADWGFIIGEWSVGQSDFELAFYVSVQELKKRAAMLGANAIVGMRQDIDLDTNAFTFFYLQMYGTAVKFV